MGGSFGNSLQACDSIFDSLKTRLSTNAGYRVPFHGNYAGNEQKPFVFVQIVVENVIVNCGLLAVERLRSKRGLSG